MGVAIGLMIIGAIFYFLKYMYQTAVLKKSKNEILLEELEKECLEYCGKLHLLTSEEKFQIKRKDYKERIAALKLVVEKEKQANN